MPVRLPIFRSGGPFQAIDLYTMIDMSPQVVFPYANIINGQLKFSTKLLVRMAVEYLPLKTVWQNSDPIIRRMVNNESLCYLVFILATAVGIISWA